MPHVRGLNGGLVTVSEATAAKLVASGQFVLVDTPAPPPESPAEDSKTPPQGDDTPEPSSSPESASERPAASVVRAWARDNGLKVPAKGRVPDSAYVAYTESFKN